jgi:hypothetical protein
MNKRKKRTFSPICITGKDSCLFCNMFVAYGDRQRCRDTGSGGSTEAGVGLSRGMTVSRGEGRVIIGGRGTGAGTGSPGGMAG